MEPVISFPGPPSRLWGFCGHFGTLDHLWDHFGTILGPSWDHFGTIFGTILGPFWDHFGAILVLKGAGGSGLSPKVTKVPTSFPGQ